MRLVDSTLVMLNVRTLRDLAQSDARVAWAVAEEVTRRLFAVLEVFAGTVFGTVRQRVARSLSAQLRARGYSPTDVGLAVLSHLHQDHIGGIRELPHAEFMVAALWGTELADEVLSEIGRLPTS